MPFSDVTIIGKDQIFRNDRNGVRMIPQCVRILEDDRGNDLSTPHFNKGII